MQNHAAITPYLLAIEKIFTELLKTREMVTNIKPSKIKGMHSKLYRKKAVNEKLIAFLFPPLTRHTLE